MVETGLGSEYLREIGPFFALQEWTADGDWRPLEVLRDGSELDERVDHTRRALEERVGADVEHRVAASTMSLGLFARLLSPQFGAAALGRTIPSLAWDTAYWQPTDSGPWPLALTGAAVDADPEHAVTAVVLPLAEVISERYSLSAKIGYGNVASSVFGAVRTIGRAYPSAVDNALRIAVRLLEGPLRQTGVLVSPMDVDFRRHSCCLFYRVPGGGYCGDCVLRT